jgi:UDP-GlcNAc:undecaprenyl-phosphate GlcNAc-1-phosphate transferase
LSDAVLSNFTLIPSMMVAFIVTVVFMFALRPLAQRIRLVDCPGGRKAHNGDVPIIGGIAMSIGAFSGLVLISGPTNLIVTLLLSSLLLVIIGVLDDKYALTASVRMSIQIAAVLIMYYGSGFRLADIGDPFGSGIISMGPFTLIFTTLVALTVINAYNLIDGADGLAGSLSLIALLAVSIVGGVGNLTTAIALTVSAAIIGFLVFNYPVKWNRQVRSFMGDAGSTFLGFSILWIILGASQGSDRLVSPVVGLWFASIPIYDLLTCFVKRTIAGKSPFLPGRDHFHHVLNRGTSHVRRTLLVLTALQAVYAGVGLAGHFAGVPDWLMFAGWSILGLSQFLIVRKLAAFKRWFRLRRRLVRRMRTAAS